MFKLESEYQLDKNLSIVDALLGKRYILKLTTEELDTLIEWNDTAIYGFKGKLYYKGHEIERID